MTYIMGIDQGSSKTHVIVGDGKGNVLGFGNSYGACHSDTGIEFAFRAIKEAMEEALKQSELNLSQITAVAAGMTGVDWKFEAVMLKEKLEELTGVANIIVMNDCLIAMRAGCIRNYGAVLCAGSGLNCAVRNKQGKEFVYGFYIDEEYQGGSALGRACIRTVINAQIGLEQETMLTDMILKKFDCKDVDELLFKKVTGVITSGDYLQLPILLEEAAHLGDRKAKEILYRFGWQFGRYVSAAMKKMDLTDCEMDVVLSGSVFKCREPELRQGVTDHFLQEAPLVKTIDAIYEPIVGAYLIALEEIKQESLLDFSNLENSCKQFQLKRM